MEQKEKSAQELKALEQVKKAQANLAKVRREEKAKARKEQDHQKFIMGGIVAKYFPECYEFSEQEMNRVLACAFKYTPRRKRRKNLQKNKIVETSMYLGDYRLLDHWSKGL